MDESRSVSLVIKRYERVCSRICREGKEVDRVKLKEDGRKRGEIDTFSRSFKKKGGVNV